MNKRRKQPRVGQTILLTVSERRDDKTVRAVVEQVSANGGALLRETGGVSAWWPLAKLAHVTGQRYRLPSGFRLRDDQSAMLHHAPAEE